jgi:hydroxymethylglutaryl-CoA lyase
MSREHVSKNPHFPSSVTLYEVGPRDGLQAEKNLVSTEDKIAFIDRLSQTGLKHIEATSFVSKTRVPQLKDATDVMHGITRNPGVTYPVLVPNMQGYEHALASGATSIAIFASASETFSQRNINATITKSLERFKPVLAAALRDGVRVRGYVSCVVACPYEGRITAQAVEHLSHKLLEMGCYEISLGETLGVATPSDISRLLDHLCLSLKSEDLALHCHDTYGQALVNVYTALPYGLRTFDASVGGLGGCPYAPGASGNLATEDLVYMLEGLSIRTGIDLTALTEAAWFISEKLNITPRSKTALAKTALAPPLKIS